MLQSLITGFTAWTQKYYQTFFAKGYYTLIGEGLKNTLIITLGALLISVVLGTLLAVVKYFSEDVKGFKLLGKLSDLYVTVIRGIPVVVLLMLFYYVIMKSADGLPVAILTFGFNSAAYMAEIIRSGIGAVDSGQMEAGRSLGFTKLRTMWLVVLPQGVRHILPAVGNEFVALLKETAVAGYVAIVDLSRAGNLVRNNTFDSVNPLLTIALIYLVLVVLLSKLVNRMERKLAQSER